jgi:hypothetical protein
LAFSKIYETLGTYQTAFDFIPKMKEGLIHTIVVSTESRLTLRQRLVGVFGKVKVVEDISDYSRCRYEFSEEFRDRKLGYYINHTFTAHYDESMYTVHCWAGARDEVIIRFGKKFKNDYNKFLQALKNKKNVTLERITSKHPGTGGGLNV